MHITRKIKNFDELATDERRRMALLIAEAGLEAIDTERAIHNMVRLDNNKLRIGGKEFDLTTVGKIVVSGIGKCALNAVRALEEILGDRIDRGVVLHIAGEAHFKKIQAAKGTHPLPSEANIRGATMMVEGLKGLSENDLVIVIVSGGGSTLLCLPEDMGCKEEASIINTLIRAGATIQEMNTVRKHISLARGGYLAKYAYPAHVVSLIFSDVPGSDIQFIASGPTVKDITTIEDAEKILAKYDVLKTCGIERCGLVETPKDDMYFKRVENIIAVSNRLALDAMAEKARSLGLHPEIYEDQLLGEARLMAHNVLTTLHPKPLKSVLLYGGETTVTVKGGGRGGRNIELALAGLHDIRDDELVVTVASDGRDNGSFAGALCDKITKDTIGSSGLDWKSMLDENNEYPLFEKVGNYLMTEDTGSNVSDLLIAIKL